MIVTKEQEQAPPELGCEPAGFREENFPAKRLGLFVLAVGLGLNTILLALSMILLKKNMLPPRHVFSSLSSLFVYFCRGQQGKDSWVPMMDALNVFYAHLPVYQTIFFAQKVKFQYPLSSLLPMHAMRSWGMSTPAIFVLMNCLSWISVWITIAVSFRILIDCLRRRRIVLTARQTWSLGATVAIAGLTFYPIVKGYSLGQVQTILTALFALAVWAWLAGRQWVTGLLIGIMCLMKPQYIIIPLWFALRKRWGALAASVTVNLAGFVAACAVFGWREQVDYLKVLSFMSKHGETYFANQSVNGFLHRLLFQGDNAIFQNHTFAPYSPLVYGATLATSLLYVGLALYSRKQAPGTEHLEDFLRIGLVATMASPIVWEHHYGVAFVMFAVLLGTLTGTRELRWLAVSFVLLGTSWTPVSVFAYVPVLNALQSLSLLGALLLLGLLFRAELPGAKARLTAAFGRTHNLNDGTNPQYG